MLLILGMTLWCQAQERVVVGGDISLVPAYERAGDQWLDAEGRVIPDLIEFLSHEAGWTAARVRLLVDPSLDADPGTCQDLEYVVSLGRRIKQAGMLLLLDIFYSDSWADPAQQWIPLSWGMDSSTETDALAEKVRSYTTECLNAMVAAGAAPDFVQIGNEVSYGMLWDKASGGNKDSHVLYLDPEWFSYDKQESQIQRFASLLRAAAEGVRFSHAAQAKIILHTERSGELLCARNFYEWLGRAGFYDFDIIGLSYYPFWHGGLHRLASTVRTLQEALPCKEIHLVETAYNYQWGPADAVCQDWEFSKEGQAAFLHDLVQMLNTLDVKGFYYWFPEECGNGKESKVQNGWLNRGLWTNGDSPHPLNSREALEAFKAFHPSTPVKSIASSPYRYSEASYDIAGRSWREIPSGGIYVRGKEKYLYK